MTRKKGRGGLRLSRYLQLAGLVHPLGPKSHHDARGVGRHGFDAFPIFLLHERRFVLQSPSTTLTSLDRVVAYTVRLQEATGVLGRTNRARTHRLVGSSHRSESRLTTSPEVGAPLLRKLWTYDTARIEILHRGCQRDTSRNSVQSTIVALHGVVLVALPNRRV
ncbi:MAG: hypothetical protein ABIT38_21830 [Gemmatimonadaceae bacterium]